MLPDLFTIPLLNLPIHTYGVMIVTGFLLALYVSFLQAKKLGCYSNDVLDFGFWALLGGILGSRIVYIMVEWRKFFITEPFIQVENLGFKIPSVLAFWQGGLVIWGGILGGFTAFLFFAYKRKIKMLVFADILILGLPMGQALGRIGCVAAGCCWGKPYYHLDTAGKIVSDLPLAMRFSPDSLAYDSLFTPSAGAEYKLMQSLGSTLPLFPTQLVESFATMVIFFILIRIYARKKFHGQVMFSYFILYSIFRSIIEMFRGDTVRGFIIENVLSTSQFISILVVLGSIAGMIILQYKLTRLQPKVS